ncbi:MAG: YtxH domain-containing protein [Gemmatimonadota bacterium]
MARDRDLDVVEDDEEQFEEEELEELEDVGTARGLVGFIGGHMLGALIGAGVALMLAPERGYVTRRRIRTRFEDVRDDAKDQIEDWRGSAEREFKRGRRKVRRKLQR